MQLVQSFNGKKHYISNAFSYQLAILGDIMNKKIYRIKAGMYRFIDLFHLDHEYVMDQEEKEKFDQIIESYKGKQTEFDLSRKTIDAYPIGHLIESHGSDVYGIISNNPEAIPATL